MPWRLLKVQGLGCLLFRGSAFGVRSISSASLRLLGLGLGSRSSGFWPKVWGLRLHVKVKDLNPNLSSLSQKPSNCDGQIAICIRIACRQKRI